MYELQILASSIPPLGHPLSSRPLLIGRDPSNDVLLTDRTVSARHLAIWVSGDQVFVEDLGSKNGVWVGDDRVTGVVSVDPGTALRIGASIRARIHRTPSPSPLTQAGPAGATPVLEDVATGVRYPLRRRRVRIGSASSCDVVVPGSEALLATLVVHDDGLVQLGQQDELCDLPMDKTFVVGTRRFRLVYTPGLEQATLDSGEADFPVRVEVSLQPHSIALVADLTTGAAVTLTADNRVALLYVLARAAVDEDEGWVHEEDVITGIWGKRRSTSRVNNLNVLVCRTRKQLREGGVDPWIIERRAHHLRIRLQEVELRS